MSMRAPQGKRRTSADARPPPLRRRKTSQLLQVANWAEPVGPARARPEKARPENGPACDRSGSCRARAKHRAVPGPAKQPAALAWARPGQWGRHVCGPFKRRSAPSSPSRRRSLSLRSLFSLAPPLSLSCAAPLPRRRRSSAAPPLPAAAAALLPRPPPIEPPLSSGPPSIPSSATSTVGAETARHAGLHPFLRPPLIRRSLPSSPPAAAVAGRPPPPHADRCAARARRAQQHGTARRRPRRAVPGPGCRHGGTARHGGAAVPRRAVPRRAHAGRARAVPVPCGPVGHLYQLHTPGCRARSAQNERK